jgi:hypothetical protein
MLPLHLHTICLSICRVQSLQQQEPAVAQQQAGVLLSRSCSSSRD